MRGTNQTFKIGLRRTAAASLRSALVPWIAIFALILQLGSAPSPQAMGGAGDAEAVAALGALEALLGSNVALCMRSDASAPGSPSHDSHHCCDDCAFCRLTGHAAALLPADSFFLAQSVRFATPLSFPGEVRVGSLRRVAFAQPRAPPVLI